MKLFQELGRGSNEESSAEDELEYDIVDIL
jgi:hypothetical protein